MHTHFTIPGLPNDLIAGEAKDFRRLQVDPAQTGFFEGTHFRLSRKLVISSGTPLVYRFKCAVDFILILQKLDCSVGDIELFIWRDTEVTPGGTFSTVVQTRGKNTSAEFRPHTGGIRYVSQMEILSGGSVTPLNADIYSDYDRAKTSNATAQQLTIGDSADSTRYLSKDFYYYLQFVSLVGTSEGKFALEWEERPTWP